MSTPFVALQKLPNVEGRRFAAAPLGYDVVSAARSELSLLQSCVAAVMGKDVSALTYEDVTGFMDDLAVGKITVVTVVR